MWLKNCTTSSTSSKKTAQLVPLVPWGIARFFWNRKIFSKYFVIWHRGLLFPNSLKKSIREGQGEVDVQGRILAQCICVSSFPCLPILSCKQPAVLFETSFFPNWALKAIQSPASGKVTLVGIYRGKGHRWDLSLDYLNSSCTEISVFHWFVICKLHA